MHIIYNMLERWNVISGRITIVLIPSMPSYTAKDNSRHFPLRQARDFSEKSSKRVVTVIESFFDSIPLWQLIYDKEILIILLCGNIQSARRLHR